MPRVGGGGGQQFRYRGVFDNTVRYPRNSWVSFNNGTDVVGYIAPASIAAGQGNPNTNTDWQLLTAEVVTGPRGIQGQSGAADDVVFIATTTSTVPTTPTGGTNDNMHTPTGWSRSPVSLSETTPYLWIAFRRRTLGQSTWENWETPTLRGIYAEDLPAPTTQQLRDLTGNTEFAYTVSQLVVTIAEYLSDNDYQTQTEIQTEIANALSTGDYQTESEVMALITSALVDYATDTDVSSAITTALTDFEDAVHLSNSTSGPEDDDIETTQDQMHVDTSDGRAWVSPRGFTEWIAIASGGGGGSGTNQELEYQFSVDKSTTTDTRANNSVYMRIRLDTETSYSEWFSLEPGSGGGGGGSGSLAVQDDGTEIDASADHLNFSGNGVDVSQDGDGVEIEIPKDVIDASDAFPTVDDADDAAKYKNKAIALRDGGAFRLDEERHGSQAHQAISSWTAYTDEDFLGARGSQPPAIATNLDKFFYHKNKRIWERLYNISPAISEYRWSTVTVQTAANDSNIVWVGHKTSQQAAANAITDFDNTKTYLAYFAGRVNQLTNATFTPAAGSTLTTVWNWDSIFAHLDLDIQAWTAIHTFHADQIVYVTNKGLARSKVDNNHNNNPVTDDGTNWEVFWGIATQDDGTVVDGAAEHINFTGTGVTVTQDGDGVEVEITSSGAQGEPGDDAIIRKYLYRNFNAGFTPGLPTGGTYTFATEAYANLPANWVETPVAPTSGQRQWSIFAEIDPNTDDATVTLTWQGVIQNSAGDGADGRFPIFLYQNKSGAAPTTPTNITYTFANDALGNLGDWSETRTAPASGETTYQIIATVDPDTTAASVLLTFNTPVPLLTSSTINIDASQRAEIFTFQASASVTGTANSAALALDADNPVGTRYGSGANVLISGTGGQTTLTFLKAGTYFGIWDGGIDVDTVRPIPVLELYNNGDTFGTDPEVAQLVGRYRRAGTDNQRFKAIGEVIIPADNTVLQASVTSLSTFSTAPVYNSRDGSRLTLIRMGAEGSDFSIDDITETLDINTLALLDRFLVWDDSAGEHRTIAWAQLQQAVPGFHLYDDVTNQLGTLADNDRMLIADVSNTGGGRPNRYVRLDALSTYFGAGGGGGGIGYQYHADRTIVTSTPLTNTTSLYLAQDSGDIYDIELVEHTDLPTDFLENLQEFTPIELSATGKSWTGHITVMEDVSESGAEFKADFESRTGTFEAGDSVRISFGASPANIGIETDGVTTKGDGRHSDPVALNTPNDLGASDDGKLLQYDHTNRRLNPVSLTTRGQEIARTDAVSKTGDVVTYSWTLDANAPTGFSVADVDTGDNERLVTPRLPLANVNGIWIVSYIGADNTETDANLIEWGPGVSEEAETTYLMVSDTQYIHIRFGFDHTSNDQRGITITGSSATNLFAQGNLTVRAYLGGVFLI